MRFRSGQRIIKKETQEPEKHFKKYSTSLSIKEIQIKTTLGFHFTPVRIVHTNKISHSSCWQR